MLGFALVSAGIFLVSRAHAMSGTIDHQLNNLPDPWYDFTDRTKMFGFGAGMIVFGCISFYGTYVAWFRS